MNKIISDFKKAYDEKKPYLIHGDLPEEVGHLPFLNSLESLLLHWPYEISAHLPDVRDEASSIDTSIKDAPKLFANGMGLLFNDVQRLSPILLEWLEQARTGLGLSSLTYGRCLIYATPDGKGTAPHFDQNINFVLQIHGTKIWKMAANQDVENPLSRHTMGLMPDPELMSYLDAPLATVMPEDAETFELHPGSLLYVPRGYWHSTEAAGDALALNFTFTAPAWLDLFTAAVRGRLAQSPEWRETAHPDDETKFEKLLSSLKEDLTHWNAKDILSATEPEDF